MPFWVVFTSCTPAPEPAADHVPPAHLVSSTIPEELDFGELPVGSEVSLRFELVNDGRLPVRVEVTLAETAGFSMDPPELTIPANGTEELAVRFSPAGVGPLESVLGVRAETWADARSVMLRGTGLGPKVRVEPDSFDLGELPLGCVQESRLAIGNEGNADLHVEAASWIAAGDFTVEDVSGLGAIQPGTASEIAITFAPSGVGSAAGVLLLQTDDPISASAAVSFAAEVISVTETFTWVYQPPAVDLLLVVEDSDLMAAPLAVMRAGVPWLVALLAEHDVRIGVMSTRSPLLVGAVESTEAEAATRLDALLDLPLVPLAGALTGLDILVEAGEAGGALEPGGPFLREAPTLVVVALTGTLDASTVGSSEVLSFLRTVEADPGAVVVGVLSGDWPDGCGDLLAANGWYEMSVATGGLYESACAEDFTSFWEDSTDELLTEERWRHVDLPDFPIASTIQVRVDGLEIADWTYAAADNAVRLGSEPAAGATVTVEYTPGDACP